MNVGRSMEGTAITMSDEMRRDIAPSNERYAKAEYLSSRLWQFFHLSFVCFIARRGSTREFLGFSFDRGRNHTFLGNLPAVKNPAVAARGPALERRDGSKGKAGAASTTSVGARLQ